MRRNLSDDYAAERESPVEELSFADVVDNLARKIVTAIVIAGGLIALAIYFRPSPPRYQAAVGDGRIVRVDSKSGTVIACQDGHCYRVLRRDQDLDDPPARKALPAPAPAPAARQTQTAPASPSNAAVPAR